MRLPWWSSWMSLACVTSDALLAWLSWKNLAWLSPVKDKPYFPRRRRSDVTIASDLRNVQPHKYQHLYTIYTRPHSSMLRMGLANFHLSDSFPGHCGEVPAWHSCSGVCGNGTTLWIPCYGFSPLAFSVEAMLVRVRKSEKGAQWPRFHGARLSRVGHRHQNWIVMSLASRWINFENFLTWSFGLYKGRLYCTRGSHCCTANPFHLRTIWSAKVQNHARCYTSQPVSSGCR